MQAVGREDGRVPAECKLWEAHGAGAQWSGFALGDKQFLTVLDNLMGNVATIFVWDLDLGNIANTPDCPVHSMKGHTGKCSKALWGPLNETIFSASDDTTVRVWDPKTGTQKAVVEGTTRS